MNIHCFSFLVPLTYTVVLIQMVPCHLLAQVAKPDVKTLTVGPFSIKAPLQWADSAFSEKVQAQPLYSEAEWKSLQENSLYTLKPAYENRPQHWAIRFPALMLKEQTFDKQSAGDYPLYPQILIHQTNGWATIFENGVPNAKKATETRHNLRRSLATMQTGTPLQLSPAFVEGSPSFLCLKKQLNFQGGHGYRLICQWTIEPDIMRRGELHYLFVGLSDDDSCQIIATFPVNLPALPSSKTEEEHLGYSTNRYGELVQNIDTYSTAAVSWLTEHEKDFTPSLDALDRLIESLSADTWR